MPNDSTRIPPGSDNNLAARRLRTVPEILPPRSGAWELGGPLRLKLKTQSPTVTVIGASNLALNPWSDPDQLRSAVASAVAGFSDRDSLLELNTHQLSNKLGIPLQEIRPTLQGLARTAGIADWNDDMQLSKITEGLAKKPASEVGKAVLKQIEKMPPAQRFALVGTLAGSVALTSPQLTKQIMNGIGVDIDILELPSGKFKFYVAPFKGASTWSVNTKRGDVGLAASAFTENNYKDLFVNFAATVNKGALEVGASLTTGGAGKGANLYAGWKINPNVKVNAELTSGNGSQQAAVKFERIF